MDFASDINLAGHGGGDEGGSVLLQPDNFLGNGCDQLIGSIHLEVYTGNNSVLLVNRRNGNG
jgi:hypothetical protein